MRVIALDTTTRNGSVALVEDERIVDERASDGAQTDAQRLPGEIVAMVDAHGLTLADLDLYAVASGPGSFTGLRIGIATMQGLALVSGRRIAGISALDALAELGSAHAPAGTIVAAWVDAHRREVFAALYRVTAAAAPFGAGRLIAIEGPTAAGAVSTLMRWREHFTTDPAIFIGDGAVLYADAIGQALPGAHVVAPPPLAGAIGRLAVARHAEAVAPAEMRALYVRRPDVELERERKSLEQP
jgi:tRNA threonylcarbamoyladenosine biosynthesis protein TsaB